MELKVQREGKKTSELGDPQVWPEKFGALLFRFACRRVGRREIAEELVQDTFLSAWKAMNNFEGRSSLKTWLITILKNKIIDHYQRGLRDREISGQELGAESECDPAECFVATDTPELLYERKELLERIAKTIEEFPAKMREAFLSRVLHETPADDLCRALDISESNLWVLIYRARGRLRLCLE